MRLMLAAFAAFAAFALSSTVAMSQVPALNSDGLGRTEEIEGKQALDWARAGNTRSLPGRQADARHVRGLWRTTTMASYRTAAPQWRTLIDLDALSKAENANWVWKGTDCLQPDGKRCLVYLSDGGKDAVTIREFDVAAGGFVKDGFVSPSSKQNVEWETADALLIGRDWGPGTLTASGYSMIIKRWKRGQPLDQAIEVFRGKPEDVSVQPIVLRDNRGVAQASIILRGVSFFESEFYLLGAAAPVKLPLPLRSSLKGRRGARRRQRRGRPARPLGRGRPPRPSRR